MQIKFVNLNLWQGGNLMHGVLDFLKKEKADIVTLQEVYNSHDIRHEERLRSLDVIQHHLGYPYVDFAPAFLEIIGDERVEQGNAILSKFPITNQDAIFFAEPYGERLEIPENFPTTPRNLEHVVIDTGSGELSVFNFQGVWDLNGENYSEKRKRMSQIIIDTVKNKKRVILAGDTNAKPTNQAMQNIEEYLTSVFGDNLATTFNMRRKDNPGYATAAVDMIFVSDDLKYTDASCIDIDISDHLPQRITLQL